MKKIYTLIIFTILSVVALTPAHAIDIQNAVVKVFVTSNPMDYYRPWQSHGIKSSVGSGCILRNKTIITNAHVVSDQTFIQVKRNNDPRKYTAKVVAIGQDCDLALLTVEDDTFFDHVEPIEFGELPNLQDAVTVIGYPQGGEKISITEGVVSRVELSSYSNSSRKLLAVQIDAAINPGNSGGPVIQDGKLVGIAMQVFTAGQNIGYMIPMPIIEHFFKDLEDGTYGGFPMMGINYNNTESRTLRAYYGIEEEDGGVLISKILPFAPAGSVLKEDDIVLAIDGVNIGEDGTYAFRDNERLAFPNLITKKQVGDHVNVTVIRDKKKENVRVPLESFTPLVPAPYHFTKPPYVIYGGMVFTVLSTDLLRSWGKRWWEKAPLDFNYYLIGTGRINENEKEEIVVLLNVLPDDINVGYHIYANQIIEEVNGQKFNSFKEFVRILEQMKKTEPYTLIETNQHSRIIVNNENISEIDQRIIERNNIPAISSTDVTEWLSDKPTE